MTFSLPKTLMTLNDTFVALLVFSSVIQPLHNIAARNFA